MSDKKIDDKKPTIDVTNMIENMTIPYINTTQKELERYKEYINKQVIVIPTDKLLEIYEKRILHELSYLRAEKYDSPEHKEELKKVMEKNGNDKIPRNIQNPNYDKLMSYYQRLQPPDKKDKKQKDKLDISITEAIIILKELYDFMMSFSFAPRFEFLIAYLDRDLDPRCFETNPQLYLCYLLTKVRKRLMKRELIIFNKVTDNRFDDQSASDSLHMLKDVRSSIDEYVNLANEFYEAMEMKEKFKKEDILEIDKTKIIKLPEKCETIKDLIIYIYFSYS